MTSQIIRMRRRIEVNTDPQRRSHDGCHFSSELRWTNWENLDTIRADQVEAKLKF